MFRARIFAVVFFQVALAAFPQCQGDLLAGESMDGHALPRPIVDRLGNVLFRPSTSTAFARPDEQISSTINFVPGHYYSSKFFASYIIEYDAAGTFVGYYRVPLMLGSEVRGLAFGADGFLYATMSLDLAGFAVLVLQSNGDVVRSYSGPTEIWGHISFGKIAMDNDHLYVCGQNALTRFTLGDPLSRTIIYTENQIYDVKPLPNGNLFVASAYYVDEITSGGVFVRRIHLTGGTGSQFFTDIRGIEYNPKTNILFVTHLGHTFFFDKIMRLNATTGALLNYGGLPYPDDMFLDLAGNLLVGSGAGSATFFSQNVVQLNSLDNSIPQNFVTQYAPLTAQSVVSRKIHGSAGAFDISLPGVECRDGGASGDYTIIATFPDAAFVTGTPQAQVTGGIATVGSGGISNGGTVVVNGSAVTIPLTNVANAQTLQIQLNGVMCGPSRGNLPITMTILAGDVNGSGAVNSSDVAVTKSRIGQSIDQTNFQSDVNANGSINASDVSLIKANLGTGLP